MISPATTALFPEAFESHYLGAMPLAALALALAGLALAFMGRRHASRSIQGTGALRAWVFGSILLAWAFWFMTYQSTRMLLPALGVLFAAGGWGAWRFVALHPRSRGFAQPVLALALILALGLLHAWTYSAVTVAAGAQPHPIPRALGFGSRHDYIAAGVNYYDSARWLAGRMAEGERALLIGEHRTLYFPPGVIASDWFDTPQPLPLIRATPDNDALFDRLRADHVRFVFFNEEELRLYARTYFIPRFSPDELRRFEAFLLDPRLRLVRTAPGRLIHIYEIEYGQ